MKILRKTLPILSAVLLFASCNKDAALSGEIDGPSDPEKKGVTFCFTTAEMENPLSATVSSAKATRAVSESELKNVRVLQFDGKTTEAKLIFNQFYKADQIVTDGDNKKLYVALFEKEGTCIYVIANSDSEKLAKLEVDKDVTLGSFEAMTLDFADENDVTLTDTALPMVGSYSGAADLSQSITIKLTRVVSKVEFTCNVNIPNGLGTFEIDRLQVVSAASKVAFKKPAVPTAQTGLYPVASSDNFFDFAEIAVPEADKNSVTKILYIPENLRGVVTGLTDKTKDLEHAPEYSTCIDVSGEYTQGEKTTDVTYRIYLGKNNSTDFNLIRNNAYKVTVTILGINENDKRVIVEKGIPAGKYDDEEWK